MSTDGGRDIEVAPNWLRATEESREAVLSALESEEWRAEIMKMPQDEPSLGDERIWCDKKIVDQLCEMEKTKRLLESALEREKREKLELEKNFREFLLMSNSDMLKMACKMRYAGSPFAALTDEIGAMRREKRDDCEMSLSRLTLSKEDDSELDGEQGDYFPLLALPDDLLYHTFSFLSMESRLRARVNRRLNKIELESKYYVKELCIVEGSFELPTAISVNPNIMRFIDGESYSSDCIRRLTRNVSLGILNIELTGSSDFHRDLCNLIKDFDTRSISLRIENEELDNEIMVDSFFLDLTKVCKYLYLHECVNVSLEAIHQVYQAMIEGSTNLRYMELELTGTQRMSFLALIGITYRDGNFFSNRNIEAFEFRQAVEGEDDNIYWTCIFDGNLEIAFDDGVFSITLHQSRETLDKSKNCIGSVKVDIIPE